jgi:hypothetical protein
MTESPEKGAAPRIEVTEHGPYRVSGDVAIRDTEGNLLRSEVRTVDATESAAE